MRQLDLSDNPRIPILVDAVRALSAARIEMEVSSPFVAGMRRAYGTPLVVTIDTQGREPGEYRVARIIEKHASAPRLPPADWLAAPDTPVFRDGLLGPAAACVP